jgi:small subunit ribosomal protein S7
MSRRKRVITKEVKRDLRYGSPLVARLISTVMRGGKRSLAERIVYTAIESTRDGTEAVDPLDVLQKAMDNARPRLEVKSRRVGGATYQVPMEVPAERQLALAMRWIVGFANKRKSIPMSKALASELKEAASNQGAAIKKRDDLHKMAQANRAFAHFRW